MTSFLHALSGYKKKQTHFNKFKFYNVPMKSTSVYNFKCQTQPCMNAGDNSAFSDIYSRKLLCNVQMKRAK